MGNAGTKKIVLFGIWLALLVGVVVWIKVGGTPPPVPPSNPPPSLPGPDPARLAAEWPQVASRAAAPARGKAGARYTLAEFGDFQCPQCGKAKPVLEKMLTQYPDQVNLIFLHRPFPNIHKWALPAGQASEIAAAQGKFWPMYDVLYAHQDDLEPGFYGDYAAQAGMDKAKFKKAFDSGEGMDRVREDSTFADTVGIELTPTVLLYDKVAKTVTVYAGMDTKKNLESPATASYAGIDKLAASPPWSK